MLALSRQLIYLFPTALLTVTALRFFLSAQSSPAVEVPAVEPPAIEPPAVKSPPVWLIATMSPAHSQLRRNIIRATWQTLYPNPAITFRFVLSDPEELWMPLIHHENATYGDLIVLRDLEESYRVANTVKSIHFFQYLAKQGSSWKFVSKMDTDAFLDVPSFYRTFIAPHLDLPAHPIMIGRPFYYGDPQYIFPSGSLYTLSWDLVLTLVRLYDANPIEGENEDLLVGRLLHDAGESFDFVELDSSTTFDLDEKNWDKQAWEHRVMDGAMVPHQLKDDETYLRVAAMFDVNGLSPDFDNYSLPSD